MRPVLSRRLCGQQVISRGSCGILAASSLLLLLSVRLYCTPNLLQNVMFRITKAFWFNSDFYARDPASAMSFEGFTYEPAFVLWTIVLLHNLTALELKVTTWWSGYKLLLKHQAAPECQNDTNIFDCGQDIYIVKCCVSFTSDASAPMSSKIYLWLLSAIKISAKIFGHQMEPLPDLFPATHQCKLSFFSDVES